MATILVVDDEEPIRDLVAATLDIDGYRLVTAVDGFDALDKLAATGVDLVICDVMMPRMSGFQLLAAIRTRGLRTPVILMSASSRGESEAEGVFFLRKPFDLDDLRAAVAVELDHPAH